MKEKTKKSIDKIIIIWLLVVFFICFEAYKIELFLPSFEPEMKAITMVAKHNPPTEIVCKTTKAWITKYSWTGYTMANGEFPYLGAVASSDRSIPLGTLVKIMGEKYIVKDRTALWIHDRGTTFDIYSEETIEEMLKFGRIRRPVDICI